MGKSESEEVQGNSATKRVRGGYAAARDAVGIVSTRESFLGKRRQGGAEGVKEEDDDGMAVVVL